MIDQPITPTERVLEILSSPGGVAVLRELLSGPKRFSELQNATQISPRTLSMRLKEMEAAQILIRTQYPEIPPRVEYRLTERGEGLRGVLEALEAWQKRYG
ncbi:winged helix-turn-helix transcriptional regulator [Marinithermus hydrothermalis]|uniref:Transcriptional regulator, HxlR family n=1 Tax=Marinithermus hydrothermalis (strain DSM 14884 / JCM 11576 / T1) TaxID=869210 RepID=F2NLQ6_MARHT|nr:helix-turn-helix domain-containing protein [Marinithermus hydrothermalis]AEB10886.1 transcriptional regulator, HxlR family [Marinithermus hydrothermalis DSM 14884]